jgi:hypothetical protein
MRRRVLIGLVMMLVVGLVAPGVSGAHTLSHSKAKRAGQKKADAVAGKSTKVKVVQRITRHRYGVFASWTRTVPGGCKGCGYDTETGQFYDTATTEYCSIDMRVRFRSKRSRQLRVSVVSSACF